MISAAQLQSMRSAVIAALPDVCSILRPVAQTSVGFASPNAFQLVADDVCCRVAPLGGGIESQLGSSAAWMVTLPADASVQLEDVLLVNTVAFDVTDVAAIRSEQVSVRVRCVRRRDQGALDAG